MNKYACDKCKTENVTNQNKEKIVCKCSKCNELTSHTVVGKLSNLTAGMIYKPTSNDQVQEQPMMGSVRPVTILAAQQKVDKESITPAEIAKVPTNIEVAKSLEKPKPVVTSRVPVPVVPVKTVPIAPKPVATIPVEPAQVLAEAAPVAQDTTGPSNPNGESLNSTSSQAV